MKTKEELQQQRMIKLASIGLLNKFLDTNSKYENTP